jgi:hypothetical protein
VALGCTFFGSGVPPSLTDDPGTGCLDASNNRSFFVAFTGVPLNYWSSSANEVLPYITSLVDLVLGNVGLGFKNTVAFAWPVRGGH